MSGPEKGHELTWSQSIGRATADWRGGWLAKCYISTTWILGRQNVPPQGSRQLAENHAERVGGRSELPPPGEQKGAIRKIRITPCLSTQAACSPAAGALSGSGEASAPPPPVHRARVAWPPHPPAGPSSRQSPWARHPLRRGPVQRAAYARRGRSSSPPACCR